MTEHLDVPDVSVPDAAQALLDAVDTPLDENGMCTVCRHPRAHTADCEWEALRAALAAAPPTPEPAQIDVTGLPVLLPGERLPSAAAPLDDEPADLSELRRLYNQYEAPTSTAKDLDAIVAARELLAEAVPGLVSEIERLRAAAGSPPPTPDDPICHGGGSPHPFEPGIDVDAPDQPDPRWCNVCGEARAAAGSPPPTPDDPKVDNGDA